VETVTKLFHLSHPALDLAAIFGGDVGLAPQILAQIG
jgi:hypothetical protein